MTIGSVTGTNNNMQAGRPGMNMQGDSVSKNIQNQIANAQKRLQELSSNEEMSLEEKMKKRQEIQQEITNLNQQLRQHQIEQRKEQQAKASSMEDMLGGSPKAAKSEAKGTGLSKASMQAMISADVSMKKADVQGSMAVQMEGKAHVLEAEIKTDKNRGGNTEQKEAELADLKANVQAATASQISNLADANKAMAEAAEEDRKTEPEKSRSEQANQAAQTAEEENRTGSIDPETGVSAAETAVTAETPSAGTAQPAHYTPVDIRL